MTRPSVLSAVCYVLVAGCAQHLYVVTAPVADLRVQPVAPADTLEADPLQETQLVYGERVRLRQTMAVDGAPWARVAALEQAEWTHGRHWEGYPGWVRYGTLSPAPLRYRPDSVVVRDGAPLFRQPLDTAATLAGALPLGAAVTELDRQMLWSLVRLPDGTQRWMASEHLRGLPALRRRPIAAQRAGIVAAATELLGTLYWWGGRSAARLDCSGLVNLSYRLNGLSIPRDAHEQYLRARPVSPARLRPGDLLFLSDAQDPHRIVHVMLDAGGGWLIEGPGTGLAVRRIRAEERLGRPPDTFRQGEGLANGQRLFGGSYLDK